MSLSTILMKDGVAGTDARIDWTYEFSRELDEGIDEFGAGVDVGDTGPPGVCPVMLARVCVGKLNAGDVLTSCTCSLFAARNAWNSLQWHIKTMVLTIYNYQLKKEFCTKRDNNK